MYVDLLKMKTEQECLFVEDAKRVRMETFKQVPPQSYQSNDSFVFVFVFVFVSQPVQVPRRFHQNSDSSRHIGPQAPRTHRNHICVRY